MLDVCVLFIIVVVMLCIIGGKIVQLTDIVKALQTYIRVEQKDRLHTVNRYQHVVATDYDEAELMRPQIISHLDIISKRINQAINMLSRVPRLEKKIRVQIGTCCFC